MKTEIGYNHQNIRNGHKSAEYNSWLRLHLSICYNAIFSTHMILRTSRFSTDFGMCEFVSELCFERFFRRLLFFSTQLIAKSSWAKVVSLFEDI